MEKKIFLLIVMTLFFGCITQAELFEDKNSQNHENVSVSRQNTGIKNESSDMESAKNIIIPYLSEAEAFAQTTSTYAFDGSDLEFVNYSKGAYVFSFVSSSNGYGNRSGIFLDGVRTGHTLMMEHDGSGFNLALVDGVYDEVHSILLTDSCPMKYKRYEWENGTFCYRPSKSDGTPCAFSSQCVKGACRIKSPGSMGPIGLCSDYMYGCYSWLYDQEITRVDSCKERDYPDRLD